MLKYQNPSATLEGVHAKVAALNRKLAAQGVRLVPYIDRDDLVRGTVQKVGRTIAEGIGLVFVVLIVFLGSPRSALVVAVTAARYGVNMADVQNVIQTGVGQFPVSTVYVGERVYNLTVRFTEATRNNPEALGALFVNTAGGVQVPLSHIADIRVRSGESIVTREMGERNLTIRIDNRDRDLTSYLQEARQKIADSVLDCTPRLRQRNWGQVSRRGIAAAGDTRYSSEPAKRKRALLGSNPPRNSRRETHDDEWGADEQALAGPVVTAPHGQSLRSSP